MRKIVVFLVAFCALQMNVVAQKNSAEIIAQIKGLKTVGSVLYFAAHPDDENNSFLLCDLDKDIEKQQKLLELREEKIKYFNI